MSSLLYQYIYEIELQDAVDKASVCASAAFSQFIQALAAVAEFRFLEAVQFFKKGIEYTILSAKYVKKAAKIRSVKP